MFQPKYLLIFFLIQSAYSLAAQNAFYDAIRINQSLQNEDIEQVIPILLNFNGKGQTFPWEKFTKKYPDHFKSLKAKCDVLNYMTIDKLLENESKMKELIQGIGIETPSIIDFKMAVKDYYRFKDRAKQLDEGQISLLEKSSDTTKITLADIEKVFVSVNEKYFFDSVIQSSQTLEDTLDTENSSSIRKSIQTRISEALIIHINEAKEEALSQMEEQHAIIANLVLQDQVYFALFKESRNKEIDRDFKLSNNLKGEQQRMNDALQQANGSPTSNFRLPSQAEMIDALAIYLAKRVKQEVSLHFIEKLSTTIRDHSIMSNLFPATLKLLNNREAYTRPNFGTSWQIALSEDFIKIPENITQCLPSRYQPMSQYIDDGVRISKLVQQHYSFPEAVNLLYSEPLKVPELRNSNSFIYILNHEFYKKNDSSNYWISAEQLQQLDREELEWLYILLDIRYGDSLNEIMSKSWLGKSVWSKDYFHKKIFPFRNWLTRILVQLNHFERELKQVKSMDKGNVLSGYWKFQNELMDVILDSTYIHINKRSTNAIGFTRTVFTIYSSIEQKNYPAVVDQVLKLFSLLDVDKQANLQDVLFTRQFYNAINKKDVSVRDRLDDQLIKLNKNYDILIHSNDLIELENSYASLQSLLYERGRQDAFVTNASPTEFSHKLIKTLSKGNRVNIDSFLLKPSYLKEIYNDKSRNGNINKLLYRIKNRYAQLDYLTELQEESVARFDSLRIFCKVYGLEDRRNFKINLKKQSSFANNKIFNIQTPAYGSFLNRIEGRNQYQRIRTAMSFMSDVMQSGNSQDLSRVIEAYSLPPSSYKLKRYSRFTINIDALVGGYFGVEFIKDIENKLRANAVGGLAAPIGLSMSWGKRRSLKAQSETRLEDGEAGFVNRSGEFKKLKGYNVTVQMNLIDLGAVVSYRITGSKDGGLPSSAKWSQVFSPGLMTLVGIRGMPLCVGTGARFTPKLRTLDGNLQRNALRFDIGLFFDLPLVNIYYR